MFIRTRTPWHIATSEVTPESCYNTRRKLMVGVGSGALLLSLRGASNVHADTKLPATVPTPLNYRAVNKKENASGFYTKEDPAPYTVVTQYNNFYEFGTGKSDPAKNSRQFRAKPWSVSISGEAEHTGTYTLEDILKPHALEERIYRLRCVEAWSMVIPWIGFPLAALLKRFAPKSSARYVAFETLVDPEQMPGQRSRVFKILPWPYTEGLRMDEAMHPLSFMAVGLYGKTLPAQNGAPLRLVVPWKYGFKSIKSIVAIHFSRTEPKTTWNQVAPQEYGFYANVNPKVNHPRWSQAFERRLPGSLLSTNRIPTQMFNGYEEQVATLYQGMNLRRYY